jgi:hypothetical protein
MICCTEPVLTEVLCTLHIHNTCDMYNVNYIKYLTMDCWQWLKGDSLDLSSERAPHRDNTETIGQEILAGHKFQSELDTKSYWLSVVTWLWPTQIFPIVWCYENTVFRKEKIQFPKYYILSNIGRWRKSKILLIPSVLIITRDLHYNIMLIIIIILEIWVWTVVKKAENS